MNSFVRKCASALAVACLAGTALTGCGNSKGVNTLAKEAPFNTMTDGKYYVYHADKKTIEPLVYDFANFSPSSIESTGDGDSSRVLMFTEKNWKKIPTLTSSDKLVYFTKDNFTESFTFERFFDYGWTTGVCGIKRTTSGRCSVSTDTSDYCTYPGSDADALINYDTDYVIIDTFDDDNITMKDVKDVQYDELRDMQAAGDVPMRITPGGTITGLKKDMQYTCTVYAGTEMPKSVTLTAYMRALGGYQTCATAKYEYNKDDNYISIDIPEFLAPGYYTLNGGGMFRYSPDGSYQEGAYLNDPYTDPNAENGGTRPNNDGSNVQQDTNDKPTGTGDGASVDTDMVTAAAESGGVINTVDDLNDKAAQPVEISAAGHVKITAQVRWDETSSQPVTEGLADVKGVLTAPDGSTMDFQPLDNGNLFLEFDATQTGTYTATFYDLQGRLVEMSMA